MKNRLFSFLLILVFAFSASAQTVTVDSGDAGYTEVSGSWKSSTAVSPYFGSDYRHNQNTSTGEVEWDLGSLSGDYQVSVIYSPHPNRASDARYTVDHAGGSITIDIDQTSNTETWVNLGTYTSPTKVTLDASGTNGYTIADAVRAEAVNGTSATSGGYIKGTDVTYKSGTEVTVTAGTGEINSNSWQLNNSTDLDLTDSAILPGGIPAGDQFLFVYVDESASTLPTPTFRVSTTEPIFSGALQGWYDGTDRCVGIFRVVGGAVAKFTRGHNKGQLYPANPISLGSGIGTNGGVWSATSPETSTVLPNIVDEALIYARFDRAAPNNVMDGYVASFEYTQGPASTPNAPFAISSGVKPVQDTAWIGLGPSKNIRVSASSGSGGSATVKLIGVKINR